MYEVRFGPRLTAGIKALIIVNVIVYIVQLLFRFSMGQAGGAFEQSFALIPEFVTSGYVWQVFTYQFLHKSTGFPFHILFNMYALYVFGCDLEERWGRKAFIKFYLVCGTGAGLFIFLLPVLFGEPGDKTLGASGAVFGVLLAYAIYWPDRKLLLFFVVPVKVKYYVMVIGFISLWLTFQSSSTWGISHVGHLGGLITGYLYLLYNLNQKDSGKVASWNLWARYKNYRQRKRWLKKQQDIFDMQHMDEKVDSLLDKISRKGIKSLSAQERQFLKRASETMDDDDDIKPGDVLKH